MFDAAHDDRYRQIVLDSILFKAEEMRDEHYSGVGKPVAFAAIAEWLDREHGNKNPLHSDWTDATTVVSIAQSDWPLWDKLFDALARPDWTNLPIGMPVTQLEEPSLVWKMVSLYNNYFGLSSKYQLAEEVVAGASLSAPPFAWF